MELGQLWWTSLGRIRLGPIRPVCVLTFSSPLSLPAPRPGLLANQTDVCIVGQIELADSGILAPLETGRS